MIGTKECATCYKFHHETITTRCRICKDFKFPENILCELTRAAQAGEAHFECFAFRPQLSIVTDDSPPTEKGKKPPTISHSDFTDKIQWLNAYAQQQFKRDPNHIESKLHYHLCLLTTKRHTFLADEEGCAERLGVAFQRIGGSFQGVAHLLGLGADHLHIYVDASPDYSLDEIGSLILDASEDELDLFLAGREGEERPVLERNYFVETIG
ncbi:MAG: transposase [Thermodesulfobacteriota bacterium]